MEVLSRDQVCVKSFGLRWPGACLRGLSVTLLQNLKKLSILLNYLIVNLKFYSHGASTQLNLFAGTNEKFSYLND